jgi:DnaJ-class molecular chaperone
MQVADEKAGHTPGDLVLKIKTVPHKVFHRNGDDLHITLQVHA